MFRLSRFALVIPPSVAQRRNTRTDQDIADVRLVETVFKGGVAQHSISLKKDASNMVGGAVGLR